MIRIIALALVLSGCAAAIAPIFPSYRDQSVAIASKADFDPTRYAGRWYEIARFPVPFQRGCFGAIADYGAPEGNLLQLRNTCLDAEGRETKAISGKARVTGPGRLTVSLSGVPFSAPYWVLWTDTDYRTAVVGLPNGRAGWILNRQPQIPPDRLRAALEVLDFNGYNTDQLQYATAQDTDK